MKQARKRSNGSIRYSGANGDHRYCKNERDVGQLRVEPPQQFPRPALEIEIKESESALRFSFTVAYLPHDVFWALLLGSNKECGLHLQQPETLEHAPNSRYPGALTKFEAWAGNAVWSAAHDGCAHVRYTAEFGFDELVNRCGADHAILAASDVRAIASLVTASLYNATEIVVWSAPFSLYSDRHNSLVLLTQALVSSNSKSIPSAQLRSVQVDPRGQLGIMLQTRQSAKGAQKLSLESVHVAQSGEPSFELVESGAANRPYVLGKTVYVQNWSLESESSSELFDGDFRLHFESDSAVRLDVTLFVRIAAPALADRRLLNNLHSSMTVHFGEHGEAHAGQFESGTYVCVQTHLIAPAELSRKLHVEVLGAWLCPTQNDVPEDANVCPTAHHRIVLVGKGKSADTNATVLFPGKFGPMSAGVCFTADALFKDDMHRTTLRTAQRFECKLAVDALQYRTEEHQFRENRLPYAVLGRTETQDFLGIAAALRSQWMPSGSFAAYTLTAALATHEQVKSTHSVSLNVRPSEQHLHNLSSAQTSAGLIAAICMIVCFVSVLGAICVRSARARDKPRRCH